MGAELASAEQISLVEQLMLCFLGGLIGYAIVDLELIRQKSKEIIELLFANNQTWITFLVVLIINGLLGVFVCYLYFRSGQYLSPTLAVHIGATAPLILGSRGKKTEPQDPGNKINK